MRIEELPTPALLLDLDRLEANLATMAGRTERLGVALRPHLKTHKCVEIAQRQRELGARGVTVSTLYEAQVFAEHGFDNITWAFPVIHSRIAEALELASRVDLGLVVDSLASVEALARAKATARVWLKVDAGYHRAGVDPESEHPVQIAEAITAADALTFAGILSHSGNAYDHIGVEERRRVAEQERDVMARLADRLRKQGIEVPEVSVGSTPGFTAAEHLEGITEARPGNYAFFDFTQVVLGSCSVSDCAVTALSSVVSTSPHRGHSVIDAGALSLSKDPGPGRPDGRSTMGEIFADYAAGELDEECRVRSLSQEHGIVDRPLPVGTLVRVLPNHACLAVACFDHYEVVRGNEVVDRWAIHRGRR